MFFEKMRYQGISLAIHAFIVLILVLFQKANILSPSKSKDGKIKIIGQAVRVDIVAMPKLTIQELKAMQEAAPGETAPTIKTKASTGGDENTIFHKKTKKKSFADLLKNLGKRKVNKVKKKKVTKKKNTQTGAGGFSGSSLRRIQKLGNKLAKGTALYGKDTLGVTDTLLSEYSGVVVSKVRVNWRLPSYLKDKGLSCKIRLYISKSGKIIKYKLYETSGNKDFDSWAIRAVEATTSLKSPPKQISSDLGRGSLILAFPL